MSSRLVTLAKDNGSNDNITIIVVFFRPVQEIVEKYGNKTETDGQTNESQEDLESLYEGITSTSPFIGPNAEKNMNGAEESEVVQSDQPADPSVVPEKSMFDSPSGGGMVFGDSNDPFGLSNSANVSGEANGSRDADQFNGEQFKQGVPSMFEQSLNSSPSVDVGEVKARGGSTEEVDFMANQEHNWIQHEQHGAPGIGGIKTDSGFISPACGSSSQQQSASPSEDSAESQADRREVVEAAEEVNREADQHVGKDMGQILASVGGGQLPNELMDLASKVTPESSSDEEEGELKQNALSLEMIQV